MNIEVLNSSSARVSWPQPYHSPPQNVQYKVTAEPADSSCRICQAIEVITLDNSTVLYDLELLAEYQFSVRILTCNRKLESKPLSKSGSLLCQ